MEPVVECVGERSCLVIGDRKIEGFRSFQKGKLRGRDMEIVVGSILGQGAFGEVFLGETSEGEKIALKHVKIADWKWKLWNLLFPSSQKQMKRTTFDQIGKEMDLHHRVSQACIFISQTFGEFHLESDFWGAFELVPVQLSIVITLAPEFKEGEVFYDMDAALLMHLLIPIMKAMQHIHDLGIMHLDVKPANIQINPIGIPKLLDFGLAIENGDTLAKMCGTPGFTDPFAVATNQPTMASDMFSFACTVLSLKTLPESPLLDCYQELFGYEKVLNMDRRELSELIESELFFRGTCRRVDLPLWATYRSLFIFAAAAEPLDRPTFEQLLNIKPIKDHMHQWEMYTTGKPVDDIFASVQKEIADILSHLKCNRSSIEERIINNNLNRLKKPSPYFLKKSDLEYFPEEFVKKFRDTRDTRYY